MVFFLLLASCASTATNTANYNQAKQDYARGDYQRAFQELWEPAKNGDYRAQYAMGYMYYYGIGTAKNQDLGRNLIQMAANKNYPPAVHAMELITKREYNQYLPFEKYSSKKQNEGMMN